MTEQRPEDQRLDPDVPQEGPEFERFDEATAATQWPIVQMLLIFPESTFDEGVLTWRQWLTGQGRRPMGDPVKRLVRYADMVDPATGEHIYEPDDPRDAWVMEGPVDAIPPKRGV